MSDLENAFANRFTIIFVLSFSYTFLQPSLLSQFEKRTEEEDMKPSLRNKLHYIQSKILKKLTDNVHKIEDCGNGNDPRELFVDDNELLHQI